MDGRMVSDGGGRDPRQDIPSQADWSAKGRGARAVGGGAAAWKPDAGTEVPGIRRWALRVARGSGPPLLRVPARSDDLDFGRHGEEARQDTERRDKAAARNAAGAGDGRCQG